jgi:hypothetical protein
VNTRCRDGHDSITSDFCSECGLEMGAVPTAVADDPTPIPKQLCPACTTERDDPSSPFCGVCGFNFVSRVGGHVVAKAAPAPVGAKPVAVARPAPQATARPAAAGAPLQRIEIEVTFDESHADAPKGAPARKFALYDDESLLGRRSQSVAQTVGLEGDDFLSRRHLLIVRSGGGYVARLFDNTNGGKHNGEEMTPGVEVPLAEGDVLTIGSFTRIRVTGMR